MCENENSKELLLALLYANTEAEIAAIIQGDAEMKDAENWRALDGRDTNFNVVNNQSSNGAKAATELMTNMVDAILMKRCREEGIDPKGDEAPETMYEAVDKFVFQLNGGKIINADKDQLKPYAEENLIIGVSGGKKSSEPNPCFTFCDNGEGQHPDDFVDTFLSLRAKNKSEIPFVQGKYNMGSSGVLGFCGNNWYKLILSRRYDGSGNWGWTLMRRKAAVLGMDYVEYFSPRDTIKSFVSDDPIAPFKTQAGDVYEKCQMETGTVVKLYEYYLGKKHVSYREPREVFNENLVETILPFRIWDFRQTPTQNKGEERKLGIDSRSFCGMEYLLIRSHVEEQGQGEGDEKADRRISISKGNVPDLGEIQISAILVKKSTEKTGWYKSGINRVFHHVNGQVQFKNTRGYLTQCGLPALKDRVVIFVDASNLDDSTHQILWKGDRESIRETTKGDMYLDTIKKAIKESPELKKLNHEIAKEELENAARDNSRALIEDLIRKDDNFKHLLDDQVPDAPVGPGGADIPEQPRDLSRNPTYIQLERNQDGEISLPVNRQVRAIQFDTDAEDDFISRPDNQGYLTIDNNDIVEDFIYEYNLRNGKLTLYLRPIKGRMSIGKEYSFRVCLNSAEMPQAVCIQNSICLKVVDAADPQPQPEPQPPRQRYMGLPHYQLLTKDGREVMDQQSTMSWEEFSGYGYSGCGKADGGFVSDLGDEKMHYINYDNAFFQNYLRKTKGEKSVIEKKYILGMRIAMLGMEFGIKKHREKKEDFLSEEIDEVRRAAAQGAATVILTLCDQMPNSFNLFDDTLEDSSDA